MGILSATTNGLGVSLGKRLLLATIPTVVYLMVFLIARIVGEPGWEPPDWIFWSLFILYPALIGVFVLVPFITTKSSFALRASTLVLASILIPYLTLQIYDAWTHPYLWTWPAWTVYAVLSMTYVLVAYMSTKKSLNLRVSALVPACLLVTPVWELIEEGQGFFNIRPYLMIFTGVAMTLLYAAVLVYAASLRVSRAYWIYTILAGIGGSYITAWNLFGTNEFLFLMGLLIWQLLFCTAVYFGLAGNKRTAQPPSPNPLDDE